MKQCMHLGCADITKVMTSRNLHSQSVVAGKHFCWDPFRNCCCLLSSVPWPALSAPAFATVQDATSGYTSWQQFRRSPSPRSTQVAPSDMSKTHGARPVMKSVGRCLLSAFHAQSKLRLQHVSRLPLCRAHDLRQSGEAGPSEAQAPSNVQSTGKGGRPKSSVWKYFETERKRDDKSKREDVRCKCGTLSHVTACSSPFESF